MSDKSILIRRAELEQLKFRKKILIPLLLLFGTFTTAHGQTILRVALTTGSDDLRGGNSVFVKLNFTNGESSTETRMRVPADGIGQNVSISGPVPIRRFPLRRAEPPVPLGRIRSVTIRHDGSPRSGNPFDTYDNWDLQAISVSLINSDGSFIGNIYNSANDPIRNRFVQRFSGDVRQIVLDRN